MNPTRRYPNDGSAAQRELLTALMEECSEVIQASAKMLRFGISGQYPDGTPNRDKLRLEMADVLACWDLVEEAGVAEMPSVEDVKWARDRKLTHMQFR